MNYHLVSCAAAVSFAFRFSPPAVMLESDPGRVCHPPLLTHLFPNWWQRYLGRYPWWSLQWNGFLKGSFQFDFETLSEEVLQKETLKHGYFFGEKTKVIFYLTFPTLEYQLYYSLVFLNWHTLGPPSYLQQQLQITADTLAHTRRRQNFMVVDKQPRINALIFEYMNN